MGRIVINKTENGQTIILNDTAEDVSGGYFDKEMEWHELGEASDLMTFDTSETCTILPFVTGQSSAKGYFYNAYQNFANNRKFICAMKGDKPLEWTKDNGSTFEVSPFYPMKVPTGSTKLKVILNPADNGMQTQVHFMRIEEDKYVPVQNTSWITSETEIDIPESEGVMYFTADIGRTNNTAFGSSNDWGKFPIREIYQFS